MPDGAKLRSSVQTMVLPDHGGDLLWAEKQFSIFADRVWLRLNIMLSMFCCNTFCSGTNSSAAAEGVGALKSATNSAVFPKAMQLKKSAFLCVMIVLLHNNQRHTKQKDTLSY